MFKAIGTKTIEGKLAPVAKTVKFNRGSIDETVTAAARLSISSDVIHYIIPSSRGLLITTKQSDTKITSGYYEVNGRTVTKYEKFYQ